MVYSIIVLINGSDEKHVFLCKMHNIYRWHQKLTLFSWRIWIQEVNSESCGCVVGHNWKKRGMKCKNLDLIRQTRIRGSVPVMKLRVSYNSESFTETLSEKKCFPMDSAATNVWVQNTKGCWKVMSPNCLLNRNTHRSANWIAFNSSNSLANLTRGSILTFCC